MKAMKFRVKDEQHSKEIQEALFAAGYGWGFTNTKECRKLEVPFLYTEKDGTICYSAESDDSYFRSASNDDNEETVLLGGAFIPTSIAVVLADPPEKPLVRSRKQFLQERQVELLRGLLVQAEAGKELDDDLTNELAEIQSKLRYL